MGYTEDDCNTVDTGVGVIDPVLGGITLLLSTVFVMWEGMTVMSWGITVLLNEGVTVVLWGVTVLLGEGMTVWLPCLTVLLGEGMEVFISIVGVKIELWT